MIGVFVGDQDRVQMIDFTANGGEASERFAFTEAGVDEDASALSFKQREVARAARRQNGYPQADWNAPGKACVAKLFKSWQRGQTASMWKKCGLRKAARRRPAIALACE